MQVTLGLGVSTPLRLPGQSETLTAVQTVDIMTMGLHFLQQRARVTHQPVWSGYVARTCMHGALQRLNAHNCIMRGPPRLPRSALCTAKRQATDKVALSSATKVRLLHCLCLQYPWTQPERLTDAWHVL